MKFIRTFIISSLLAVAMVGSAQTFSRNYGDTFTGARDVSNLWFSDTFFGVQFEYDGTTNGPLYINDVQITNGAGFNPLIDLNTNFDYLGFTNGSFTQSSYTPGTAIVDDVNWNFEGLVRRSGAVDAAVANGIYDFSVNIIGGADSSTTDTLASFNFNIEVIEQFEASAVATALNPVVGWGDTFDVQATVTNLGTRDIVTTTWYVAGFGLNASSAPAPNQLTLNSFQGDWFDKTIANGAPRTDLHSRWSVPNGVQAGNYLGNVGIIGGYYNGDRHLLRSVPELNVQVVPEPASLIALGLGAAALLRRRKS